MFLAVLQKIVSRSREVCFKSASFGKNTHFNGFSSFLIILGKYGPGRREVPRVGVIFCKKMFPKLVVSTIDGLWNVFRQLLRLAAP